MDALRQVDRWPAETVAAGVVSAGAVDSTHGPTEQEFRWASVTKPATALAVLVAAEEAAVDLDEPAGPPGSTVRHLLAHTSGLPFEGREPIAPPGVRRIYSNAGFECSRSVEAKSELPFAEYLRQAVFEPLEMRRAWTARPGPG